MEMISVFVYVMIMSERVLLNGASELSNHTK